MTVREQAGLSLTKLKKVRGEVPEEIPLSVFGDITPRHRSHTRSLLTTHVWSQQRPMSDYPSRSFVLFETRFVPSATGRAMDHVDAERDALKDKLRSCGTLNTLYHETRQEVELLNKQIALKDNVITDLKARLGRYERLRVNVGDDEPVVVGPSTSLLQSLCKEICKLKQKRNDVEFKAARQEEVNDVTRVLAR